MYAKSVAERNPADRPLSAQNGTAPERASRVRPRAKRRLPSDHRRRRQGLSLLEVLFAIGIATVGLFGALALMPVAGMLINRGLVADQRSAAGKSWVEEFHIRGMANPINWVLVDGSPTGVPVYDPAAPPPVPSPFVIDPRFTAVNGSGGFPYVAAANPAVPRISIRAISPRSIAAITPANGPMTPAQADDVMRFQDDLVIREPAVDTDPPFQEFTSDLTKRQTEGNISWMAMVAPKRGGFSDQYTLWVIVFYQRDPTMAANNENERLAQVAQASDFYSGGFGGGDVRITALGTGTAADVEVYTGSWVMLAANSPLGPVCQWYRVVNAEPDLDLTGPLPARNITLQGPDWDAGSFPTPQVTVIPSVTTVYEKTIRLESPSMWMN